LARRSAAFLRLTLLRARRLAFQDLPYEEAEEVRAHIEEEGALTERYALMCALSAGIATLGLLQSSSAVVIGAMLVSPLMGPIAALGFGLASLESDRIFRAARAVGIGVAVGIFVGMTITWLSPIRNATPEIVARTAPTLLDLAIALLSGLAGGYATVHRRGETAIGVAIATALMPPLATLGYSIAVWRLDFVFGALLLFLTNLAAISFAFALVTRLRGVARPFRQVKITRRLLFAGATALLVLATPLALTLHRVSQEAVATAAARRAIADITGQNANGIAQLDVSWPNLERPHISAIVVTEHYIEDVEAQLAARLQQRLSATPDVRVQQLVATNTRAETQAMIEAALAPRAGVSPPIESIRQAARLPSMSAWADLSTRTIYLVAAPLPERSLVSFREEERRLDALRPGWRVSVIPPFQERLWVGFDDDAIVFNEQGQRELDATIWALRRWGAARVRVEGISGRNTGASASSRAFATARAAEAARRLRAAGFEVEEGLVSAAASRALYEIGGIERVRAVDICPLGPAEMSDAEPAC
jgi:uncharacterized hydrophobic protein (TIGR00271 family)